MALIVEDGTGLEDANTYIALTEADSYHGTRLNSAWAEASEDDRTKALIAATEYLDGKYRRRWRGLKSSGVQALEWPRLQAYDDSGYRLEGVPARLKNAVCEAALTALATELDPALERGGAVKRETVGPISTEYRDGNVLPTVYPAITRWLKGLITGNGIQIRR